MRKCSRSACDEPAVATLTYVYADSTAVLGPLATYAEPHCYDLCAHHAERLTAPRGWEIIRLAPDPESMQPSHDDLEALADAVREAARPREEASGADGSAGDAGGGASGDAGGAAGQSDERGRDLGRRGHLRVLRPSDP